MQINLEQVNYDFFDQRSLNVIKTYWLKKIKYTFRVLFYFFKFMKIK